jgi:hypothetical protein
MKLLLAVKAILITTSLALFIPPSRGTPGRREGAGTR